MFSKAVIGSARFLRMPPSSRLLYYDLGMEADDDGCVEAFSVMRKTGATEDDLRVLVSKGFVRVLNDDLVAYILDWDKNNQIRKDRYHPGIYKSLILEACSVVVGCFDSQTTTDCQPSDNQTATEVRLGKARVGEDRTEGAAKPPRTRFVPPSVEEVRAYCKEKGYGIDPERFVDYYQANGWVQGKGKPIKDWKACVRTWANSEGGKQNGKAQSESGCKLRIGAEV